MSDSAIATNRGGGEDGLACTEGYTLGECSATPTGTPTHNRRAVVTFDCDETFHLVSGGETAGGDMSCTSAPQRQTPPPCTRTPSDPPSKKERRLPRNEFTLRRLDDKMTHRLLEAEALTPRRRGLSQKESFKSYSPERPRKTIGHAEFGKEKPSLESLNDSMQDGSNSVRRDEHPSEFSSLMPAQVDSRGLPPCLPGACDAVEPSAESPGKVPGHREKPAEVSTRGMRSLGSSPSWLRWPWQHADSSDAGLSQEQGHVDRTMQESQSSKESPARVDWPQRQIERAGTGSPKRQGSTPMSPKSPMRKVFPWRRAERADTASSAGQSPARHNDRAQSSASSSILSRVEGRRNSKEIGVEGLRQLNDEGLAGKYQKDTRDSFRGAAYSPTPDGLTQESPNNEAMEKWAPPLLLRVSGILPWCPDGIRFEDVIKRSQMQALAAAFYQLVLFMLSTAALAICVVEVVSMRAGRSSGQLCDGGGCLYLGLLSDLPIALGSVLGLIAVGALRHNRRFLNCYMLLLSYAQREGLRMDWVHVSRQDLLAISAIWAFAVEERWRFGQLFSDAGTHIALNLAVFAFSSGVLMSLAFAILHMCRLLTSMIDAYCFHFVTAPYYDEAVHDWNILQAILRQACEAMQHCFLVLQTTALAAVLLCVTDMITNTSHGAELASRVPALVPASLITFVAARIFFCAGAVTEKCARVPTFMNAFWFDGKALDLERQYVVAYIINSAAGFYVLEVRVTSGMALKLTYFSGVAAFALATKLASSGW